MARRNLDGSRAIVTGASSGIGRELVRQLADAGARVVALARREERLRALADECAAAPGTVTPIAGDVTDAEVRRRAVEAAQAEFGGLDLLVNNAGVGAMGLFENADPDRLRRVMEVNFFALVELTRLALPVLRRGTSPMIVNVSSILGRRGVPYSSEYSASKFAVHGFSEALRAELSPHGIDLLVVSPGTTETEFFDSVIERTGDPPWPEHRPVSAAEVARRTILAMRRGKHEIVPYLWGKVLLGLNRLSPTLVDRLMTRYV
ncbi:MAG: SDR family oxidoreductase [Thermoguttaceae bacterium]